MTYIRLSIVKPLRGRETEVEQILRRIADLAAKHPGCLESYLLKPHDNSGDLARMAIYENEAAAERAAADDSVMVARADLHLAVEPGQIERAFEVV